MWATRTQATALAMVASKSLARRVAAPEPGKGALDHPTAGQDLEAFGDVRAFDCGSACKFGSGAMFVQL